MTGKHVERAIPPRCPNPVCRVQLGTDYATHCDTWCGWVNCGACRVVVDTRSGRYFEPPPTNEPPKKKGM